MLHLQCASYFTYRTDGTVKAAAHIMLSAELESILENHSFQPEAPLHPNNHELIQNMTTAWINEANAPDLLEFQEHTVEKIRELLNSQAAKLDCDDQLDDPLVMFIAQQEMERIKFVIRSYLRVRIEKVF